MSDLKEKKAADSNSKTVKPKKTAAAAKSNIPNGGGANKNKSKKEKKKKRMSIGGVFAIILTIILVIIALCVTAILLNIGGARRYLWNALPQETITEIHSSRGESVSGVEDTEIQIDRAELERIKTQLEEKETFLKKKEEELNQKEQELIERENKLAEAETEILTIAGQNEADIQKIRSAAGVLKNMDPENAADILEKYPSKADVAAVLKQLQDSSVADITAEMSADFAADVLRIMETTD